MIMPSSYEPDYTVAHGFVGLAKVVRSALPDSFDCASSDESI